jgi:hypothetical protein
LGGGEQYLSEHIGRGWLDGFELRHCVLGSVRWDFVGRRRGGPGSRVEGRKIKSSVAGASWISIEFCVLILIIADPEG